MPAALESSLARLGRPAIDLYMHHFPSRRVSIPRLMGRMADAVYAGKIRAVGVSNYSADQLRIAHAVLADRGVPLASIEIGYSLLDRRVETNGVLDACRELSVTLIAYQPLASGALTGKYADGARPTGLRRFMRTFRGSGREAAAPVIALLREIGARHDQDTGPGGPTLADRAGRRHARFPAPRTDARRPPTPRRSAFSLATDEIEALSRASAAWR